MILLGMNVWLSPEVIAKAFPSRWRGRRGFWFVAVGFVIFFGVTVSRRFLSRHLEVFGCEQSLEVVAHAPQQNRSGDTF